MNASLLWNTGFEHILSLCFSLLGLSFVTWVSAMNMARGRQRGFFFPAGWWSRHGSGKAAQSWKGPCRERAWESQAKNILTGTRCHKTQHWGQCLTAAQGLAGLEMCMDGGWQDFQKGKSEWGMATSNTLLGGPGTWLWRQWGSYTWAMLSFVLFLILLWKWGNIYKIASYNKCLLAHYPDSLIINISLTLFHLYFSIARSLPAGLFELNQSHRLICQRFRMYLLEKKIFLLKTPQSHSYIKNVQ